MNVDLGIWDKLARMIVFLLLMAALLGIARARPCAAISTRLPAMGALSAASPATSFIFVFSQICELSSKK